MMKWSGLVVFRGVCGEGKLLLKMLQGDLAYAKIDKRGYPGVIKIIMLTNMQVLTQQ